MEGSLETRLLAAARQLLDGGGVEAVTIREVARRCGVSHGAPRRYFPSLASLHAAVARQILGDLARSLADAGPGPVEQARAYVAFAEHRPESFDLVFRHDLLEGSGAHLRRTSLPLVESWISCFRDEKPTSTRDDALAAWVGVHGIAVLTSRRALDLVETTSDHLLTLVLR